MKVAIIGCGLIGGSFLKSLISLKLSNLIPIESLVILDKSEEEIDICSNWLKKKHSNHNPFFSCYTVDNFLVKVSTSSKYLFELVSDFDLIFISTPICYTIDYINYFRDIYNSEKFLKFPTICDFASVKLLSQDIYESSLYKDGLYIPCHPICGKESGGFLNSVDDLFFGKNIFITSSTCGDNSILLDLFHKIQANFINCTAEEHDKMFAYLSHIVQLIYFFIAEISDKKMMDNFLCSYVNSKFSISINHRFNKIITNKDDLSRVLFLFATCLQSITPEDYLKYSGSGFKDFVSILSNNSEKSTRLFSSPFELWLEIFHHNHQLLQVIIEFRNELSKTSDIYSDLFCEFFKKIISYKNER